MIESASHHDAEDILSVINTSNRDAYKCIFPQEHFKDPVLSLQELQALFERMAFYVYRSAGQIVGVAALHPEIEKTGRIRWVYILPEFQKRGIGTALVKHVEDEAKKKGLKKLRLLTSGAAIWAIEFYQKLGYHLAGKKDRPWGFDVVMEREMAGP
jgi:N-acetylglutamate synthase-like GNAT family acetyltransferase